MIFRGIQSLEKFSFINPEEVEDKAQQQIKERSMVLDIENFNIQEETAKFDICSSLVFFLVKEKDLQSLIPDHEIYACKEIFFNSSCHESRFGLGRLLAYQNQFHAALEYFKLAIEVHPDPLYKQWQTTLWVKVTKLNEIETIETKNFLSQFLCNGINRSRLKVSEMIDIRIRTVENYWAMLEMSTKGEVELEVPEYYAARILEIDRYFGYLAWSSVFFNKNEWQKGLDILKQLILSHSKRPEAYLRLWYHYYYNVKDYEQADCIISEAFLMVNPQDFHEYYILFCIYSAKTLMKLKKTPDYLTLMRNKFMQNPTYPIFLFIYGKYCVKSEDYNYNGTGIGALQECIRLCDNTRLGPIYYWLAKGYMQSRQHIEAYETVKLALAHLNPRHVRKMTELKCWIVDIQPSIEKVEKVEKILAGNFNAEGYKLCKNLCSQVNGLHKITVDILLAKMMWKTGRHDEALKKLYAVSGISTVKMNAHFLLIEYLGLQNNFRCLKNVASEMVAKCKNPQVPAYIWVKANMIYAKILVKNKKPGKAILILKLIAKLLPPIPFASIQYTKFLQRAKDLQDLTSAHAFKAESMNTYNFSSYKNSFIDSSCEVRDMSYKIIAEEAAPLPALSLKFASRRSERVVTERVSDVKLYYKKKTQQDKDIEGEFKKDSVSSRDMKSLSLCSDPIFLYKIGKIALRHNILLHDGVCAIRDYIELLKFEKERSKALNQAIKAEKVYREICGKIKGS